ncbi:MULTISPECIES: DUF1653 domain-containing protein [unclassified Pseudoalteromonas]|uniref:DUF1653 domain-containing protein n=1 Tax=unclassified Pseudoalteromonas TaxID=194690 RepID=UPI00301486BA
MQIIPGIYRHYKGNEYRVYGLAKHSESEETLVLYQPLYGEQGLWVRPLSMFVENVTVAGQTQPRFALLEPEPGLAAKSGIWQDGENSSDHKK